MAVFLMIFGAILSVVAKVGEYLVPPIKRQFNYMCCYGNNIKELQCEVDKLQRMEAGVRLRVVAARRNLEKIVPDVENWLREVENIKGERHTLHEDAANVSQGCIHGGCTNMKSRYQLSRRAGKITKSAIRLQNEGNFGQISCPVPFREIQFTDPPVHIDAANTEYVVDAAKTEYVETESPPIESDNRFLTRKFVEERIIAALQDSNVKMIGLCGMGGVGKTTMVRRIGKLLKENKMFDEIVMAVVTQHPDPIRIQTEIAEMLDLKLEAVHESSRGTLLRKRILNEERVLVILDDIWGRLDLDILGIPLATSYKTCKVLFTSRAQDICVQMGADKTLQLQVLSREEAWILFSEEAGLSSDCPNLYPIAKEIANECKGLPVALVSVARALKQKSNHTWENALIQLRSSTPTNILGVLNDVYRPLELSYLALEGNEAKDLFLFCSLFREDSNICIENLVRYGIGLDIFKGINNIREGRIRTHALVEVLKDRFLLLDGHKEGFVKMHDVVRDVAISVASKDKPRFLIGNDSTGVWSRRSSYRHCTHISLFSNFAYIPEEINFPNLVFLSWESTNKMGDLLCTFEKFRKLNVLYLCHMDILAVPSSIQKLTNLRAVHLCGSRLENLSIIGELINLEILCFQCTELKIFPAALGKLANLRLLDLTDCENLQEIEQGAIGGLVKLEELYVTKNFAAWGARLAELERLPNLTTLRISIANRNVVSGNINLCSELKEYDISIRAIPEQLLKYHSSTANIPHKYELSFQKVMDLYLPEGTHLGEWGSSLLKRTDDLRLSGDGSNSIVNTLGSECFQHLRQLGIQDCETVEHLVSTTDGNTRSFGVFPILETLYLHKVSNINHICIGQQPERSFGELRYLHLRELIELKHFHSGPSPSFRLSNLRSIYIYQCQNLKSLFSNSVAQSLLQLEELDIGDCQGMEKIFFHENGQDRTTTYNLEFPKLEKLVLRCLHSLTNFSTGIDGISFPRLRVLKMEDLQSFEGFCTTNRNLADDDIDLQILFNKKVDCPRIKTLSLRRLRGVSKVFCHQLPSYFLQELEFMEVDACSELNTIFSPTIARGLVKPKELRIKNCRALTKVIENQNANTIPLSSSSNNMGLFHQLEYLEADTCPRLKTLFTPSIARDLVKLKVLRLRNCKELEEVIEKEDEQVQVNKIANPFPQLRYLLLLDLPNFKTFWNTPHDFEIPSLRDVIADHENSPIMESLAKIAKNAKQMVAYRNKCKKRLEERDFQISSIANQSSQASKSCSTQYASCQSHICDHQEEQGI